MEDKEFFKQFKKESKEYSDKIEEGFCNFCLKIYFPEFADDEIEDSLFGLNANDDSIDSFLMIMIKKFTFPSLNQPIH